MDADNPRKMHAHSFRVTAYIRSKSSQMRYNDCEQAVAQYLNNYEGIRLNDLKAFKERIPTIENMCFTFYEDLKEIVKEYEAQLIRLELGDSPVASFAVGGELLVGSAYNMVTDQDFEAYEAYLQANYHLGQGRTS